MKRKSDYVLTFLSLVGLIVSVIVAYILTFKS